MPNLVEVDSLEALIIIDNELDLMSRPAPDTVSLSNTSFGQIALGTKFKAHDRGVAKKELRMEAICCAAHGYSVLITASKDGVKHSVLFDAGPEGDIWERNVKRLAPDLATVELVQLSHWHRDHSGGMAKAVEMISAARKEKGLESPVVVDLHPSRPDFRGMIIEEEVISLEADPSFSELEAAGGKISKNEEAHTVLDDFFLISGMIPRTTSYELGVRNGVRFDTAAKTWTPDEEIRDERFLMVNLKGKGLITFTGCSHAGAINVSKHSLTLGSPAPLYAVVGGYHLAPGEAEQVSATVRDLVELNPRILVPGHCSGWRVKFEIEKYLPGRLVPCSVGLNYVF